MLQATICDRLAFERFAFEENGLIPTEVDIGWGQLVEALVMSSMSLAFDERRDLAFEFAGQVIVLKQEARPKNC